MAVEATADEKPVPAPAPAKSGSKKLLLIIGAIFLLAAGAGGGYFLSAKNTSQHTAKSSSADSEHGTDEEGGEHDAPKGVSHYLPLQPPFVINLADEEASRYLQVEIELMSHDAKAIENVKTHMPRIRNSLLLLLGQQRVSELTTREGKEQLQARLLDEIRKIMEAETGKPGVDAVYFTSFVMQ